MSALPSRDATSLPALADRCVQCGLCLPHCPTYQLDRSEAESPRGRIAYARAVSTGLLAPTPLGDQHLDHCLGCLSCERACPAGVEYGALLQLARAERGVRRPLPLKRRIRIGLLARPKLLGALLRIYRFTYPGLPKSWRSLPRPPARSAHSPADAVSDVSVFWGCVGDSYEAPVRAALDRCLERIDIRAIPAARQTCCGTAAAHAGDTATAQRLAEANRRAFAASPTVISLASGCRDILRSSLAGTSEVIDAMTFLHRWGDKLQFRSAAGKQISLHFPCSQRLDEGSGAAVRALLGRIPDLEVRELPDTGCCGAAGLHMLDEPERAARLRAPLIEVLAGGDARELLSANIGCRLHLANGTRMPVRHPIEFIAEHLA